jgi:glyoxalase family protein
MILGIHHITAIAGDPQRNLDFYTSVLGLRLVKLTVNFDDPGTYHFYFGNDSGTPGSILTFFPWPHGPRGVVGTRQVSAVTFAIPRESLPYWYSRFSSHNVAVVRGGERFGEPVVAIADPDGLPIELIATSHANPTLAWHGSSVEPTHAICGFHSATVLEETHEDTGRLLTEVMHFTFIGREGNRFRYHAAGDGAASVVDLVCTPGGRLGRLGTGTVHHIAWRTPDERQQLRWRDELVHGGYDVTPVIDRTYFRSIYYREPGGVLFEIATSPPGFAIDEPKDHLGEMLMLPQQYEAERATIERLLPRVTLPQAHPPVAR